MSLSLAGARFQLERALGLYRRGLASLRTRGPVATWQRVSAQLGLFAPATAHSLLAADMSPFAPFPVPAAAEPEVSIVIPVHGHVAQTVACLRAIAAFPPAASTEVIVVDTNLADSELMIFDAGMISMVPMASGNADATGAWQTKDATQPGQDGQRTRIIGDWAVEARNSQTHMARIYNIG